MIWALSLPVTSLTGAMRVHRLSQMTERHSILPNLSSKNVLIIGSGPSLDLAGEAFFEPYDSLVYINYAIKRVSSFDKTIFFTTDIGVLMNLIHDTGWDYILRLGRSDLIVAPIFFEQVHLFPKVYQDCFTWLRADQLGLKIERAKNRSFAGVLSLPYTFRFYPKQIPKVCLNVNSKMYKSQSCAIPILEHTSALSAICFSAARGAKRIDMIGCDFSAGRSKRVSTSQPVPTSKTFSGARDSFFYIQDLLRKEGIDVRNVSWDIRSEA